MIFLVVFGMIFLASIIAGFNTAKNEPYYRGDLKAREIEMYENFKREMALISKSKPSINYQIDKYKTGKFRRGDTIRKLEVKA